MVRFLRTDNSRDITIIDYRCTDGQFFAVRARRDNSERPFLIPAVKQRLETG